MLDDVNNLFVLKSFLTTPKNVLPFHLKQIFLPIIWIFTEGDGIESRLPFKIFSTLINMAKLDVNFLVQNQTTTCNYCTMLFNFYNFSKEHPYFRIRSNCKGVCLFQGVHLFWTIDYVPLAIFEILENFRHRNLKLWNLLLFEKT